MDPDLQEMIDSVSKFVESADRFYSRRTILSREEMVPLISVLSDLSKVCSVIDIRVKEQLRRINAERSSESQYFEPDF